MFNFNKPLRPRGLGHLPFVRGGNYPLLTKEGIKGEVLKKIFSNKRIIFAGGTDWSVEFLNLLCQEGFNVIGVIVPPDSKKGRGQKAGSHVLKIAAKKSGLPVFQPEKLNDPGFLREFKQIMPDLVVVVAYGKLFPKAILAIPPLGFINFHPSLLPKLRGPSPIASAILEGHKVTGVSIMKLGEGMDDGPVLAQKAVKIDPRETIVTLTRKLVRLGKRMLPDILAKYLEGEIIPKPQAEKGVTICKIIKKENGRINWSSETATQIDRKVRALNPQFKTFTFLEKNNKKLRVNILESAGTRRGAFLPGQYNLIDNNLATGTKEDLLLVSKLQVEGKKPISAEDFVRGYGGVDNKFFLV